MPDLAMCMNKACPSRVTCFRFLAKPGQRQAFMDFRHKGDKCDNYLPASAFASYLKEEKIEDKAREMLKEMRGE